MNVRRVGALALAIDEDVANNVSTSKLERHNMSPRIRRFTIRIITIIALMLFANLAFAQSDGSIAGLKSKFADVNGVHARYYETGKGEPMVLIHGGFTGGSSTANVWS